LEEVAMTTHGWHFTPLDRRLRYGDGREVIPGETLTVDVQPILCEAGLHQSPTVLDALRWAPGPYLWRTSMECVVARDSDKECGWDRTALWGFDATEVLQRFARLCALDVVHLWDAPEVVVRYLRTGDEEISAAATTYAAYAAADAAAADAAAYAAAAHNAARLAAHNAARLAARVAAYAAASAAAYAAAYAAVHDAARPAAYDVAHDAARDRQRRRLASMVTAEARRRGLT